MSMPNGSRCDQFLHVVCQHIDLARAIGLGRKPDSALIYTIRRVFDNAAVWRYSITDEKSTGAIHTMLESVVLSLGMQGRNPARIGIGADE